MYATRQQAYAPTPYIPRSTLSATINLDEVLPPAPLM
jgi:ESCRT-I complex subunit VPS28